jgi:serine/threonine protein kinase
MNSPRVIGRYQIQALLGGGAMGEVYRAHDPVIDRPVAIKLLRPELIVGGGSDHLLERFRREARAAGRRFHPNIVAIWDFGDDNGTPFLVMEFVDGRNLDQIVKESSPLEPGHSVAIMTQVLSALGFAHENGIVHRDVKPSNIIVLPTGQVKVADFGIARIDASDFTIVGDLLGTPAYMAPEQLAGAPVDHRTDLFAAAVILFEIMTGVKPFRGKSITEIISHMEKRGPEDIRALNAAVPDALKRVVTKSLAFDPAQRFPNAATFSQALSEAVADLPIDPKLPQTLLSKAPVPAAKSSSGIEATASDQTTMSRGLLRDVERDLASFIGPMASIVLRRALKETNDLLSLYEILGKQLANSKDRAEFLAKGRLRAAAVLRPLPSWPPSKPEKIVQPGPDLSIKSPNPASILAIESDLTRHIGPIARLLVKRELEKFESLSKFCLTLAAHIPDERARTTFLKAHGAE